jgi:hypothetical protein
MQLCRGKSIFLIPIALSLSLWASSYAHSQINIAPTQRPEAKLFSVPLSKYPTTNRGQENNTVHSAPTSINNSTLPPSTTPTSRPLTAGQKIRYGLKRAVFSPEVYIFPAIRTIHNELTFDQPAFKDNGDRVADGFTRFAINMATTSNKNFLGRGVYPALFKQNPKYVPSGKQGFGARTLYALSRVLITQGDNGNSQFNTSMMAGNFTASAMVNLYDRNTVHDRRIGTGPTFRRFGGMLLVDGIRNVIFREFGPDIKRHIFRRK